MGQLTEPYQYNISKFRRIQWNKKKEISGEV